jgi:hypothetical protein
LYFYNIYNVDILKYFSKEFDFLKKEKVISIIDSNLIKVNLNYIWEKTIYRWIFLEDNLLSKFLEKNKFDNSIDYVELFKKNTGEHYC